MTASNALEVQAYEDLCERIHAASEIGDNTFNHTNDYDLKSFPSDIRILKAHLEILHVNNCFQLKSLPPSIGDLSNLRWLNVSYNQLTELPIEVGKLRHLERLHCNNNQLTALAIEIWALKDLQELHCDTNQLRALPTGVLMMRNLRELHVENNPLLTESDVDGAEVAELLPPRRCGDCSNCCIRFTRSIAFVTFHTVCGNRLVPFEHFVESTRCEAQLRERLTALTLEQQHREEASTSPLKRLVAAAPAAPVAPAAVSSSD